MKQNINILIKLKFAILVFVSFVLSSCEKEFNLDLSGVDNRLVVNSIFNGDELLSLTLTKSMPPQGVQDIVELKNAKVSLFENGTFVEFMSYLKTPDDVIGSFYSNTKPELGYTYKVEVETKEFGKATTQSVLPQKVEIISDTALWVKWIEDVDSAFSIRFYFEIEFNDPQEENFYFITASAPVYSVDAIDNTRQFHAWQYAEILSTDLPGQELYLNNSLLFKDVTFNASLKKLQEQQQCIVFPTLLFMKKKKNLLYSTKVSYTLSYIRSLKMPINIAQVLPKKLQHKMMFILSHQ